jgi:DNA-binding NarL/FixJ family response regulator
MNCQKVSGRQHVWRALIVDDHPIVRQGLRHVMENQDDLMVCGEADTVSGARVAIAESNPDMLICDIRLKDDDGIELVRQVRAHHPQLPILVYSVHDELIYAERMLSVGASGYIMKEARGEQLLTAMRRVLEGNIYLSEAVSESLIRKHKDKRGDRSVNPIDRLSDRELQILQMIGRGMSTRETAHALHLSVKTIESHRQRIKRKLNLTTGSQLVHYAILGATQRDLSGES